ncbi:DUF2441 domain-containing protein [Endozoicomonas ascidiicola]|uniref:DUF2441 domain-containing protein n=1 Tax=Endozoicomonas ascidiicola TaxID=1698521 RepID=UPI00083247B8|nr:DUF2441 domain-containing protein [Endozoicomonas ascidiicola]
MKSCFTIDTKGMLNADSVITSYSSNEKIPEELQPFVGNKISAYGIDKLLNTNECNDSFLALSELLFEQIRKHSFPLKPSRLNSLFGFEHISEVEEFKTSFNRVHCSVFLVETVGEVHKGYFPLINKNHSVETITKLAYRYWLGEKSDISYKHPEILISFPVKILNELAI